VINCGRDRSKRCHVTTSLLPHYLVKFERSTAGDWLIESAVVQLSTKRSAGDDTKYRSQQHSEKNN